MIGRTEERKAIARRRHRSDVRPVVLLGPGGVGTTRLAIEVAAEAAPRFAAGHVVSVAAVQDHEPVLQAVADEIGLPKGPQPLPERRASQIRPQRMLLVRHNVEHVAKAATGIARITHREGDVQWLLAGG